MHSLRVNETKVISRSIFIDNHFALKSERESKDDGRTLFRDCVSILDLSINPKTPNDTCMCFSELIWFKVYFGLLLLPLKVQTMFIDF